MESSSVFWYSQLASIYHCQPLIKEPYGNNLNQKVDNLAMAEYSIAENNPTAPCEIHSKISKHGKISWMQLLVWALLTLKLLHLLCAQLYAYAVLYQAHSHIRTAVLVATYLHNYYYNSQHRTGRYSMECSFWGHTEEVIYLLHILTRAWGKLWYFLWWQCWAARDRITCIYAPFRLPHDYMMLWHNPNRYLYREIYSIDPNCMLIIVYHLPYASSLDRFEEDC